MPKIGRTLSYINTERKGKSTEQSPVSQSLGSSRPGGSVSTPQGDYLLKSIWDKVFEIRTDSQGIEYIFGKLPVVTQYGITMYSGDGVDIPSLASGLPFDGRTIWYNPSTNQIEVIGGTGGGSGEGVSNFWDLSGIPSWITNSKPKYTYSEIEGTPDLTKYALVSQIPSLSGYATESWVTQQNYATKATTLIGYGITDAYTKTNVDDLLKSYVTIGGTQTITGEKNFTGGLKVNGSPIYYDTEKKYWKLEGDLLVTGGVTMYGNEGTYTPSTIMNAILYDDTTLGINSNGQLYVKGGTSGGGLDITALQNYLTQNSYLNVTSADSRYLKLTGGILKGSGADLLQVNRTDGNSVISYYYNGSWLGRMGYNTNGSPIAQIGDAYQFLLHSGNYSNYALPLSGGRMDSTSYIRWNDGHEGNDFSDWNSVAGETGLKIISSVVSTSNAPSTYSTALHIKGRYGFQLASIGGDGSKFYIRNIRNISDWCQLIHSGNINSFAWTSSNDGSGSGLDADLLDGKQPSELNVGSANILKGVAVSNVNDATGGGFFSASFQASNRPNTSVNYACGLTLLESSLNRLHQLSFDNQGNLFARSQTANGWQEWKIIAFTSSNVASATKLQTARTIWGQSFDGSSGIDGDFTMANTKSIQGKDSSNVARTLLTFSSNNELFIGRGSSGAGYATKLCGYSIQLCTNSDQTERVRISSSGNVGIGTTNPSYKLDVNGVLRATAAMFGGDSGINIGMTYKNDTTGAYDLIERKLSGSMLYLQYNHNGGINMCQGGGNVGIGTESPSYKLDVNGVAKATSLYAHSYVWLAPNSEAIYLNATSISWHNSSNAWTDTLILFARDSITLNRNTTVQGNILATGGITMYSMRSLKNVVDERGLSLSELTTIKPTRYTWKDGRDNRLHFGGIADDIKQVLPEVVYSTSDGILTMDYGNAAFAVASSLIQPVVDHEKRIAMLQERIDELEEEIERLKSA